MTAAAKRVTAEDRAAAALRDLVSALGGRLVALHVERAVDDPTADRRHVVLEHRITLHLGCGCVRRSIVAAGDAIASPLLSSLLTCPHGGR